MMKPGERMWLEVVAAAAIVDALVCTSARVMDII
jgi:hypothetical protein